MMVLLGGIMYSVYSGLPSTIKESRENEDKITSPFILIVFQFMCCIMIHILMQPMIHVAIQRMIYISRHPYKFEMITMPVIVNLLKLLAEITIEIAAMLIVSTLTTPKDVILNFCTIASIAELNSIYYIHVKSDLKEKLKRIKFKLPIENDKVKIDTLKKDTSCKSKILIGLCFICK